MSGNRREFLKGVAALPVVAVRQHPRRQQSYGETDSSSRLIFGVAACKASAAKQHSA